MSCEQTKMKKLTKLDKAALESAMRVRENAWSHFSRHAVGAVICGDSGRNFKGTNVESAVSQDGITASRVAFGAMISGGERSFNTWVLVGSADEPCLPSGGDLQLAAEFAQDDARIVCSNHDGSKIEIYTFLGLFPHAFSFRNLKKTLDALHPENETKTGDETI